MSEEVRTQELKMPRFEVLAKTRDEHSENWGRYVRLTDPDGAAHFFVIPAAMLASNGTDLCRLLLSKGAEIPAWTPEFRERLLECVLANDLETTMLCTDKCGWHGNVYVLPDRSICTETDEQVLFQSGLETAHNFADSGSLSGWRESVGKACSGNPVLAFCASAAFAAMTMKFTAAQTAVFHLVGPTSTGKTTAGIVAGSICGGGRQNGNTRQWKATLNGLEAVCAQYRDSVLVLDDIEQSGSHVIISFVYLIANEKGASRMTAALRLQRTSEWRLIAISSGEKTLAEHSAWSGTPVRGGAGVRFIEISANQGTVSGIVSDLHGCASSREFVQTIRANALRYYGVPRTEFVKRLQSMEDPGRVLREKESEFFTANGKSSFTEEEERVLSSFASVAAAGELASEFGITGWRPGEATEAARDRFASWQTLRGHAGSHDDKAIIEAIRSSIVANQTRFQIGDAATPSRRLGFFVYRRSDGKLTYKAQVALERPNLHLGNDDDLDVDPPPVGYFVFEDRLGAKDGIVPGYSPSSITTALDRRGLLVRDGKHLKYRLRLPKLGRIYGYLIRSTVLEASPDGDDPRMQAREGRAWELKGAEPTDTEDGADVESGPTDVEVGPDAGFRGNSDLVEPTTA